MWFFIWVAYSFLIGILFSSALDSKSAENKISDSINRNGKPCEDFYDYACGNWISYHPKPPNKNIMWRNFMEIFDKNKKIFLEILDEPIQVQDTLSLKSSKTLFKLCMKEAVNNTKKFQEIIGSIGGWPMLNSSWDPKSFDFWEFLGNIKNKFGLSLLFKVDVKYDVTLPNELKNVIYVDQDENLFMNPKWLLRLNINQTIMYQNMIKTVAKEFVSPTIETAHLDQKIADMVHFEIDLAKILTKPEEKSVSGVGFSTIRDVQLLYQHMMPTFTIKLDEYLAKVFSKSGVTLLPSEKLIMVNKWYLLKLFNLISKTPNETVANYLVWRVIETLAFYNNDAMRDKLFTIIAGEPRNETCLSLAYGPGVAQKYLERHFDSATKEKIENFTKSIEKITIKFINESSLDASIKLTAISKVSQIIECIGYPDWLTNSSVLNGHYYPLKDLKLESVNDKFEFLDEVLLVLQQRSDQSLAELRKPFVKNCQWTYLREVGDTYSPTFDTQRNTINFPMGFLQPPIFTKDAPMVMNFGSLGALLGHEITHSLSDIGWTKNVLTENPSNIGKCLVDEYQSLSFTMLKMISTTTSGEATLEEDFSDNVGMQMAYHAYKYYANSTDSLTQSNVVEKESFTDDQTFFLAFAQLYCDASSATDNNLVSHSIGKYRVLGSLRNFQEFANAWQCPKGSYMNPISKCDIFNGENNTIF